MKMKIPWNENEDTTKPIHKSLKVSPYRTGLKKSKQLKTNPEVTSTPIFPFKCNFKKINDCILSKITMAFYDWHINVTQDCYQLIKLFQKSVHIPWLYRVYMNCTSHFVLKNHFTICIQVVPGKLWAEMQDYQVSMSSPYCGSLHKGTSFLLEAPRPSGHCSVHSGLQKSHGKAGKAALPALLSAAGMDVEGSDSSEQWHWLHSASQLRAAGCFRARPLKFFEPLLNHFCIWNIVRSSLLHFSKLDTTHSPAPGREQWRDGACSG